MWRAHPLLREVALNRRTMRRVAVGLTGTALGGFWPSLTPALAEPPPGPGAAVLRPDRPSAPAAPDAAQSTRPRRMAGDPEAFADTPPPFSDANWVRSGDAAGGVNGPVHAVAFAPDGAVYVAGTFTAAGSTAAPTLACCDGDTWSALGSGVRGGGVRAMTFCGPDLVVGGTFTEAGGQPASRVARWDGRNWHALGSGMDNTVLSLAVAGVDLYAAGSFTNAGGVHAVSVARWDGVAWSAMGEAPGPGLHSLTADGTNLYAVSALGGFHRWDGTGWPSLGGTNLTGVGPLVVCDTNLCALVVAPQEPAGYALARWDGATWHRSSFPAFGYQRIGQPALAVTGTRLFSALSYWVYGTGGPLWRHRVLLWSGTDWVPFGPELDGELSALAAFGREVYVGSRPGWGVAGGQFMHSDGRDWSGLTPGLAGPFAFDSGVKCLAVSEGRVVVGGVFRTAGAATASCIAQRRGSGWEALDSGTDNAVLAVAIRGGEVLAGGRFKTAGDVAANSIARWDGRAWHALGTGFNAEVRALATVGTNLHAGGRFAKAGDRTVRRVARWDGAAWNPLGDALTAP